MLPSLFRDPPPASAVRALDGAALPPGARGTLAALILSDDEKETAMTRFLPDPAFEGSWREASPEYVWPEAAEDDLRDIRLVNGKGEAALLSDLFDAWREEKKFREATEQDRKRLAQWRGVFLAASRDPLLALIEERNRLRPELTVAAGAKRIEGLPAPWRAARAGACIPPKSGFRPVYEWVMEGIPMERGLPFCASPLPVPILFEDESMAACAKPSGMSSVPGTQEKFSAKAELEKALGPLYAVHRLDQGTSGILLFAKTREAAAALSESFREGKTVKRYRARLEPSDKAIPEKGLIDLPLAGDPADRPRQLVLPAALGGKASRTEFRVAERLADGRAVLDLIPDAGRTHQLRVHCAHPEGLGIPIEGDSLYGSLGHGVLRSGSRLCLHLARLSIPHPVSGRLLTFELEPDFP